MKTPEGAPGPAHKYLYEHQDAKSTPHLCKNNSTLPAQCARLKPTTIPYFLAFAVIYFILNNCPVK